MQHRKEGGVEKMLTKEQILAITDYWITYTVDPADKSKAIALRRLALAGLEAGEAWKAGALAGAEAAILDMARLIPMLPFDKQDFLTDGDLIRADQALETFRARLHGCAHVTEMEARQNAEKIVASLSPDGKAVGE